MSRARSKFSCVGGCQPVGDMSGRVFLRVVVLGLLVGTGSCASPNFGERLQDEGAQISRLGEDWERADEMMRTGREKISKGQALVSEGEQLVEEGQALKAQSERDAVSAARRINE